MHRRELARASTAAGLQVVEPAGPVRIDDAIARYLTRVAISRSERTRNEFNLFLPQFRALCTKVYLHEITADDLLVYAEWVRQHGLSPEVHLRIAREGHIPSYRVRGAVRFDPHEIADWLEQRKNGHCGPTTRGSLWRLSSERSTCTSQELRVFE